LTKSKGHTPIRTCVACGAKRAKMELVRLVSAPDGRLVWDERQRMQGRGAYVCPIASCREGLYKHKRLNRLFRVDGPVGIGPEIRQADRGV
jgi:predicted RNA-binding protein YlxR (DUF448 family)